MNRVALLGSIAGHAGLGAAVVLGGTGLPSEPAGARPGEPVWVALVEAVPAAAQGVAEPRVEPVASVEPVALVAPVEIAQPVAAPALTPPPEPPSDAAPEAGPGTEGAVRPGEPALVGSDARPGWPGPGEVDRAARPRWPIRPDYPASARRAGHESEVLVEAWVDPQGQVAFASVLESGGEAFDASARRAVEASAFRPARSDGRDVASRVALRIHFRLYD